MRVRGAHCTTGETTRRLYEDSVAWPSMLVLELNHSPSQIHSGNTKYKYTGVVSTCLELPAPTPWTFAGLIQSVGGTSRKTRARLDASLNKTDASDESLLSKTRRWRVGDGKPVAGNLICPVRSARDATASQPKQKGHAGMNYTTTKSIE